jgi:hypothetical protein
VESEPRWFCGYLLATTTRRLVSEAAPGCGGSGDEQAKAKLCFVEIDEVVVAFDPLT